MSSRNKKLASDILIYGIGNIGSRLLVFLLFPVFSFFVTSKDLGYYDISLSTILLLIPVVTLQMREATFRLLIESKDESYRKNILSSIMFIEGCIFAILIIISFITPHFFSIRYYILIVLSIFTYGFYELFIQYVRIVYSAKNYALIGILTAFLTAAFAFSLLFFFNMGIEGLFIGNIAARIVAMLLIEIRKGKFLKNLSFSGIKKEHINEILKYSLPMLVTALAFGVISACGKYIINHYLGDQYNGYLGLAEKFASIILILGLTFYQAWQETAVKNYREKDSNIFFSKVFNEYAVLLSLLVICISFGLRSFPFVLPEEYHPYINIIFIYCLGTTFYCFAMFLEITFQCTKQTSKIIYSILTCAIITPLLSVVLIKHYGLMGNVTALCISLAYLFLFRYFQTLRLLPIKLNKGFYLSMLMLAVSGTLFHTVRNNYLDYAVLLVASSLLLYVLSVARKYIKR